MYLMIKRLLVLMTFALLFSACTTKENAINITQSNLYPLAGEIDSLSNEFSFRDEISVNGENYKLLVSNTEELESQAILSFAYLPDNVEYITDATLTIYSDLKPAGDMEFKIKRLEQEYLESEANWEEASSGIAWDPELIFDSDIESIVSSDTIGTAVDSLVFTLSNEEIKTWTENDQSLFSLILYTESDNYIELYSSEHTKGPILTFNYKLNSDATDLEDRVYERNSFKDTSIINDKLGTDQTWNNVMKINNLPPTRSFLKFDVNTDDLINQDGEELTDFQIEHLTINSAYLRLYIKDYSYLPTSRLLYLTPFRVTSEVSEEEVIDSDNLEYLINTGTSVSTIIAEADTTQYIDVKITPIVQGFISGEKDNFGIVMRSSYQSTNFDWVEFWGKDASDENLRPKVHFVYTLPLE
jgi:hypothetical protein